MLHKSYNYNFEGFRSYNYNDEDFTKVVNFTCYTMS